MVQKINIYLNNGRREDYEELERVLKTAAFKTIREAENPNPDGMGIDWATLVVMLPIVYPYMEEFRKALKSYLSYKSSQTKEFSIELENADKKMKISGKNMDIPSVDDFMDFFKQ